MNNKRIYVTIIKSEPLNKGYSENKKYCVTTTDGRHCFAFLLFHNTNHTLSVTPPLLRCVGAGPFNGNENISWLRP